MFSLVFFLSDSRGKKNYSTEWKFINWMKSKAYFFALMKLIALGTAGFVCPIFNLPQIIWSCKIYRKHKMLQQSLFAFLLSLLRKPWALKFIFITDLIFSDERSTVTLFNKTSVSILVCTYMFCFFSFLLCINLFHIT